MRQTLEALEELNLQTVFTYPNSDAGSREMLRVLESHRGRNFLRIVPNLGSTKYLSLMRLATIMVGNSSSGLLEAPSFKLPAINIGTRQHGRLRGERGGCRLRRAAIVKIRFALDDRAFREGCATAGIPTATETRRREPPISRSGCGSAPRC
jgi:UDP-N-acetylglucosamine 2-epimerase (non-hydrolysing)/GDP/UDP-N,N'-diacetylbacillosamine 2-epimerase (hydrolysing)